MLIMAPTTVWNPSALDTRRVPKKMLGRIAILPRRGAGMRQRLRIAFENQPLRFTAALSPFVAAMFIWPESALPISQAPLAMLLLVGLVEMQLLRLSPKRRDRITSEEAAARTLDALRFRATRLLSRIAARRGLAEGDLHLVVEQSELARVPPLTLVSVQASAPRAHLLDLDAEERSMLSEHLFGDGLTEAGLQRANQREGVFVRDIAFEPASVSAHARLAAMLEAGADDTPVARPA